MEGKAIRQATPSSSPRLYRVCDAVAGTVAWAYKIADDQYQR